MTPRRPGRSRLALAALLAALIAGFFLFDLQAYLRLEHVQERQSELEALVRMHPAASVAGFFLLYVAVAALSLPGAAILTLAAGAMFGLAWGTVVVSFASSIGATLAFLSSRFLFRDAIRRRHGARLAAIDRGVEREGRFYLLALRLVPAVPFFLVNLAMGLTPMRAWTYYWVSQLGMLPGTIAYVNAGTQIAAVESLSGLLSPAVLGSFAVLALLPLAAARAVDAFRARRRYRGWTKPRRYDRNLVVIGAGSAGLVCAYVAAAAKARVTLVEKARMGGDCLNTGCVPSKALIRSARLVADARRAHELGLRRVGLDWDFAEVMERVQRVVQAVEPHDSVERYRALGVECLQGEARITSPWTVEVRSGEATRTLSTRAIVIAAGARPLVPPIPGLEQAGCLTSDTVWSLRSLPRRLVVLGGGPVGCELAQCFARFGSRVTQVEMLPRLLAREDPEASALVSERFAREGIDVRAGHRAQRVVVEAGEKALVCERGGEEVRIPFDALLCAAGRVPNTAGYGLEALGIGTTASRTVETNAFLQTVFPNIYACGDVAGPYQFTHAASHQAWYAAINALFGGLRKFRVDYSAVPWATFTDPEVARVGLNETEARERGIDYEVTTCGLDELDRAIADEAAQGFVKVLTEPGRDRILGATIAGEHASELIVEYVCAMRHGIGLNGILRTIHVYPTFAEANKHAAGAWRRAHVPRRLLAGAERFHAWMRG